MTRVQIILGAASFGKTVNPDAQGEKVDTIPQCQAMVDMFVAHGHHEIDTARVYKGGTSEEYLAQIDLKGAIVDTKVLPAAPGDHAPARLREIFHQSLAALSPHKVNIFYLHAPDRSVPYEDTLRGINELHQEGLFKEFGLSNFSSWEVAEFVYIARSHGWVAPTVYTGIYNALGREVESELFPCLRKFGLRFYAYSPLANGILAGKIQTQADMEDKKGTRWDPAVTSLSKKFRDQYTSILPFIVELQNTLVERNIRLPEAAFRWLQHHSQLTPQDGIIIGASSLKQLEGNLADCEGGPLPEEIVQLIDKTWSKVKGGWTNYAL